MNSTAIPATAGPTIQALGSPRSMGAAAALFIIDGDRGAGVNKIRVVDVVSPKNATVTSTTSTAAAA
jgi:hypothetical protein